MAWRKSCSGIRAGLGEHNTAEAADAWTAVYEMLASVMKTAAAKAAA